MSRRNDYRSRDERNSEWRSYESPRDWERRNREPESKRHRSSPDDVERPPRDRRPLDSKEERERTSSSREEESECKVGSELHPLLPVEKRIMNYSEEELRERKRHRGSTLSMFDRLKFEREFDVNSLRLSRPLRKVWDQNPHLRQVFANHREFIQLDRPFSLEDLVVRFPDEPNPSPTTKYARRMGEAKTVEHWGQRKLLFSEIEFLAFYGTPGCTVVYAGAAPGTHTNFLSEVMFPSYNWVLVDPAPFDAKPTGKITIRNEFFDDKLAEEFAGQNVLFVCDIRSMDSSMPDHVKEERVFIDMEAQMRWTQIMKPVASVLKFRMPYKPGVTKYLDGRIHFPIWSGRTSSESRLVVTQEDLAKPLREYSHSWYEDLMFHFQTVTRTTYFLHSCVGEGLDSCFDCNAEVFLLRFFLHKFQDIPVEGRCLDWAVSGLSFAISRQCSLSGRTLVVNTDQDSSFHIN